jgi:hypothetical protein
MTPFTISSAICFELTVMHIFMAGSTSGSQSGKFLAGMTGLFFIEMAVAAGLFCMSAFKFKLGFPVIKSYGIPPVQIMAGFAISTRIIFFTYKSLVNILVTIRAPFSNCFKLPFFIFFVAGKTGSGYVCAFQRKYAGIVLFDRVGKFGKSFHCMACGAIGRNTVFNKLLFMVIGMAIGTALKV